MPDHFVGITNYSLIRTDRTIILPDGTMKCGGVIMYIYKRQGLNFSVISELTLCNFYIEMSVIEHSLPHTHKIYVLNVCRPGDIESCIKQLQQCVNTIKTSDGIDICVKITQVRNCSK